MAIDFSNVYIDNSGCFEYVADREQPVPFAYITNVRMLEQNCNIPAYIDPDANTPTGDPDINYFYTVGLEGTFRNNTNVTNVSLPSTLMSIGDYAFAQSSIKEQNFIPSCADLEFIGSYAYSDTTISNLVFSNCAYPLFVNDYAFAIENESYYSISKNVIFANSGDLSLSNYIFDNCTANCMFDNVYYVNLSEHTFSNMFSGSVNFNNSHICVNGNSENVFAGVNDVIVSINSIVALDGEGSQNTIKDLNKLFTNSGIQAWFDTSDRTIYTTKNSLTSEYTRWNDYLSLQSEDISNIAMPQLSLNIYQPDLIVYVENNLFSNSNIRNLNIKCYEIEGQCLFENSKLTTCVINAQSLGEKMFSHAHCLGNIYLDSPTLAIGSDCFAGCDNIDILNFDCDEIFLGDKAFANMFSTTRIPSVYNIHTVRTVGSYAFDNCVLDMSGYIPDMYMVNWIDDYAFANCSMSTDFITFSQEILPDQEFYFGNKVFDNCNNLKCIEFVNTPYDNLKDIVDYDKDFGNCSSLQCVKYNDVAFIINDVTDMSGVEGLSSVIFTNKCKNINGELPSLSNIDCVDVDEKIKVGNGVFIDGSFTSLDLTWFDISNSNYVFENCKDVIEITNVNGIGIYSFSECSSLEKVTLSSDFNSKIISQGAFFNCISLKSLNKNEIVAGISQDDVNNIFHEQGENIINIPYGIEIIDSRAFESCESITHVYIPNTVTTINNEAFINCINVEKIYIANSVQTINDSAFNNINENAVFYVDENSVAHTYCENKGFTYELIKADGTPDDIPGDLNPPFTVVTNKLKGKCFLAGVGNAELFKVVNGKEYMFASAKTLTESSITIGVSEEDIRAGMGAKLYGKYFHTSTFDLKLTDAMFRLEYLAASVGSEIDFGGEVFKIVEMEADKNGSITVADAVPMTGTTTFIYVKKPEDEYFGTYELDADDKVTGLEAGVKYCVKYLYTNDNARTLTVKANFVPDTLRLYLTCNLYSGDDKNPSTGTKIGSITVMVPRFMLKGNQDLSMSMTGAATTSLEGSALAADAEGCDGEGIYAKIIEVIDGFDWRSMIYEMTFDSSIESIEDCYIYDELGSFDKFYDEVSIYLKFIDGTKPKKLIADKDYKLIIIPNENDENSFTIKQNIITSNLMCGNFEVKAQGIGDFANYIAIKEYI